MDARQSKRGKRISLRQEKQTAADLGGRTMAASGATRLGGGADVRVMGKTRIECKFTEKDRYYLKLSELDKLRRQANKSLEYPVFQFAFHYPNGTMSKYAVIPWDIQRGLHAHTNLSTSSKQITVTDQNLNNRLMWGQIQVSFSPPEAIPETFHLRHFEILHWDDYVKRHNTDA
jgi:hypothetical protein